MKGKIYLMGAGPGDPDLLTLQAVRVLRSAEVVLHEEGIASRVLDLIPPSAQVRSVDQLGVLAGNRQERVHSALVSAARDGHQVVWLKAGDPLLSAKMDGEVRLIAEAGIDCEVVGAASTLRATASAGAR